MARIAIPLGRTFANSGAAGMQSLVNMYAEKVEGESRTKVVCYPSPGRASFATIGGGLVRGQISANDVHHAVVGTRLYSITSAGATTDLGEIEGADPVDMSFNGYNVDIVAELKSYSYIPDTLTLSEITDGDFEQASSVTNLGGYSLFAVKGSGRFRWSSHLDSSTFSGLDFATAEAEADKLVAIRKVGNEIALLGSDTTEFWYLTGDTANLFARTSTAAAQIGCVARDTAVVVDNGLTWVGRDGRAGGISVYRAEGYQPRRISTPDVDIFLESVTDPTDLHAFAYQQRGHLFYVLTNPNEWTLAWDVSTNQWSYRRSGSWAMGSLPGGSWDARTFCLNGTKQIVGGSDGNLYQLQADTFTEGSDGVVRECTTPMLYHGGRRAFMSKLELEVQTNVALVTGQGSDPYIMMSFSDDGGNTWSAPRNASIGQIGQNKYRCIWNACGSYRERMIKFRGSDPVNWVFVSAHGDVSVGAH